MIGGAAHKLRTLSLERLAKEPSIVFAAILSVVIVNMASLHLAIDAQSSSSQQQQQQQHSYQHHQNWFSAMNATLFSNLSPFRTSPSSRLINSKDFPKDYDWSRSTEDNYRLNGDTASSSEQQQQQQLLLHSQFHPLRQGLDKKYHSNYSLERQAIQDNILESLLYDTKIVDAESGQECSVPQTPWIVFTAGVYGAGKTHTIKKLQERGQFPLESFVAVDPDEIRRRLPEFPIYVEKSPERAGELTRKEAGMMAEILTTFALDKGMNVLVDGSLKDAVWYENYFQKLRNNHSNLKIGIIHVTAPIEAIVARVKQRGKATGRVVPMNALKQSIIEVPRAVKQLRGSVDFFLEIHNPQEPQLQLLQNDDAPSIQSHQAANAFSHHTEIANALQQKCAATV